MERSWEDRANFSGLWCQIVDISCAGELPRLLYTSGERPKTESK